MKDLAYTLVALVVWAVFLFAIAGPPYEHRDSEQQRMKDDILRRMRL